MNELPLSFRSQCGTICHNFFLYQIKRGVLGWPELKLSKNVNLKHSRRNNNYLSIFISFSLSNSQNYKSVKIFYKLKLYEKTLYYGYKLSFARCLIPLSNWRASLFTFAAILVARFSLPGNDGRNGLHRYCCKNLCLQLKTTKSTPTLNQSHS